MLLPLETVTILVLSERAQAKWTEPVSFDMTASEFLRIYNNSIKEVLPDKFTALKALWVINGESNAKSLVPPHKTIFRLWFCFKCKATFK